MQLVVPGNADLMPGGGGDTGEPISVRMELKLMLTVSKMPMRSHGESLLEAKNRDR